MKPLRHHHAYTLPEMLTGATLSSILVGLMLTFFNGSTTLWHQSTQRLDTQREARAALAQMERDLSQTLPVGTALPTLYLGRDPEANDQTNESVYALASLPGEEGLAVVGYECRWDAKARGFVLMRISDRDGASRLQAEGVSAFYSSGSSRVAEPLARYVWDVQVRPGQTDGASGSYPEGAATPPRWLEVRFKVAGPTTVERLRQFEITPETWANPQDPVYRAVIAPFQQQYVARIRLHAGQ